MATNAAWEGNVMRVVGGHRQAAGPRMLTG